MPSIYKVLLQEQADLKAELSAIGAKAEAGTLLSEAEKAREDEIIARLEAMQPDIQREEKRREWERNAPAAVESPRITHIHDRELDRPWGYATLGCTADEFTARYPHTRYAADHPNHPHNAYQMTAFGEFMQAVTNAGTPGGTVDPRLLAGASGPSGASTGVQSDAGFLVRKDFSMMLIDRAVEFAQLAPLCDTIPIGDGADGIEAPYIDETSRATGSRWGGVQVYRRAEADSVTATRIKVGKWTLDLEDLMGLSYTTRRAIQDAAAHGRITANAFASEFAFKIDDEIFRGTGAGQCQGIQSANCLVSVSKETGQAAATVVTENLSKMWARLHPRYRAGARWFINSDVEPALDTLSKAIGTAGVEPNFITYGPDSVLRIKGRPVQVIEHAESLGTKGDITLANFGQYVLITKGGVEAAESMHVLFLYNEMTYRWVWRINGAPKDKAAITPYKGTGNTQSAFVMLNDRS